MPVGGIGSDGFFNAPTPNFSLAPLVPVDGGASVGLTLTAVVCSNDGSHAVALGPDNGTGDLRAVYSSDGGFTWTVAGGFPIVPGATQVAGNGQQAMAMHGTTVVAAVLVSSNLHIITSTDGGANWTDTTPATATCSCFPIYSLTAGGQFIWFDGTNNVVWSAADGSTWVSNPLPAAINRAQNLENPAGTALISYVSLASDNHAEIWASSDGITWVSRLVISTTTSTPGYIPFVFNSARHEFAATFLHDIDNGYDFYTSNPLGTVWTLRSTGTQPPPDAVPAVFKHFYYVGTESFGYYLSADGVAWTPEPVANPLFLNNFWQLSGTGSLLMQYGPNVSATPDGINFGPLLVFTTPTGNVSTMAGTAAGGGYTLAVGTDDSGVGHIWRFGA